MTEQNEKTPMDALLIEALNENRERVKNAVADSLIDKIAQQYRYDMPQIIQTEMDTFIKENVVPAISARLTENKDAIVDGATQVALSIASEMAKTIQEQISKNLTQSWNVKKVIDALVG